MKTRLLVLLSVILIAGCAAYPSNQTTDQRFIPIELWAGAKWDGTEEIVLSRLDVASGKNNKRHISGPTVWRHPNTGKNVLVYERTNKKKDGLKRQLFALNEAGTSLGRVYDSRPGSEDRFFKNEAMFPVGSWRRGEERTFEYLEFLHKGPVKRVATIKIRRLDYVYKGVPHSLKFDRIQRDENGEVMFHERFVYSPNKSLVRFIDRMKK